MRASRGGGFVKKKRPQKDSPLPSGIERYTIGTGFTKRARYRIKGPFRPEHLSFIEKLWGNASEDRNTLDALIAATEASARQILTEAGLPSEPRVFYTIPEGKRFISLEADEGTGTLLDLVVARGFQERKDLE